MRVELKYMFIFHAETGFQQDVLRERNGFMSRAIPNFKVYQLGVNQDVEAALRFGPLVKMVLLF